MRLGIMQPYFFPYLEQFRLIAACDLWVVFDTVAYQRHSWMNRNRILNPDKGWTYLTVPVSPTHRGQPVAEVQLAHHLDWRQKIRDRLQVYERAAPHFDAAMAVLESAIGAEHHTLTHLNVAGLRAVSGHLGIETPIQRLSELDLALPAECGPGEWALVISKALGASAYRNPSGGRHLFDPESFREAGIQLEFHEHREVTYETGPFRFIEGLSIIDTLMWLDNREVRRLVGPSPGSG